MPPTQPTLPPGLALIFACVWISLIIGMIASWVLFLVAGWRIMKAHEKISKELAKIAEKSQLK